MPLLPKRYWTLCLLLSLATALSYLDRQVLSVLAPRITAEFGMSNTAYSRVLFAFVLSYTVMAALGGRFMDRMGTRLGYALSVGFWSLASAAHALVTGTRSLALARFALGVGEGPSFPGSAKGAVEWVPARDRTLAVGLATGGSAFGAVLAPPLSAWFAGWFGWRGTFVAVAGLGGLWLLAWILATRGLPPVEVRPAQSARSGFRDILRRPAARRLVLARFVFDPVFYFYMFWVPQYLHQARGMSLMQIGSLVWIPFFVLGLAQMGAGWVSDAVIARGFSRRRARLGLMLAGALVTPVSCFVVRSGTPALAIALMSTFMLAHGFWISNYITLIGESVGAEEVATAVGLSGTVGGISGMMTSLGIGWIVDHFSFGPVFLTMGLLYPLAWICITLGRTGPDPASRTRGQTQLGAASDGTASVPTMPPAP
jgi:ACS family hexuronate transporter-like MFS transporter